MGVLLIFQAVMANESDSARAHEQKRPALHHYLAMQYTRHHQKLPDFATILSFIGNTT
jgi:hypothetical protein